MKITREKDTLVFEEYCCIFKRKNEKCIEYDCYILTDGDRTYHIMNTYFNKKVFDAIDKRYKIIKDHFVTSKYYRRLVSRIISLQSKEKYNFLKTFNYEQYIWKNSKEAISIRAMYGGDVNDEKEFDNKVWSKMIHY